MISGILTALILIVFVTIVADCLTAKYVDCTLGLGKCCDCTYKDCCVQGRSKQHWGVDGT